MYQKTLKNLTKFDLSKPLFFDTETIGFYGRTRLVQLRQGDIAYEFDCFYLNIEDIKAYLRQAHLVAHNIHYDLSCSDFKRWLPAKVDDTMLMARMLAPELDSHSLKSLVEYYSLGEKTDEGSSDWSQYNLTESQLKYAELDTLYVEKLFELYKSEKLPSAYSLDIESIKWALVYQNKGMVIDRKMMQKYKREMLKIVKSSTLPKELNINSPKQVCEFLGVASSSKDEMLKNDDIRCKQILEQRHAMKILSYIESLEPYQIVYSYTNPGAAKTGRFICKGGDTIETENYFNLQQIPREFKAIFGVKNGALYVTADYPALEIWVAGAVIGDEFMVSVLEKKEDLHYAAAEKMFNKPRSEISKLERNAAKKCNFTLLYGAGANRLSESFILEGTPELAAKAKSIRELWLNTYPGIARRIHENYSYFNDHSYRIVYTAQGRPMKAKSAMEALNFTIQGTGAECTKLALLLLKNKGITPVATVHDSIALIASNENEAKEYKDALKWAMEEAYARVIKNCKANHLRLPITVNIGESYS